MEMPIFPLNIVLFPGMVLPLHIFEPRYREMVIYCAEHNHPFGVVNLEDDAEDTEALIDKVGTAARIVQLEELDDGRFNIAVVGTQRFRIESLDHRYSYLKANVSHYPVLHGESEKAKEMAEWIQPRINEYIEALAKVTRSRINIEQIPEEPNALAFLIAIALPIENEDKQALLELPTVPHIFAKEHYLLGREIMLMNYMAETRFDLWDMTGGVTGYLCKN